MGWGRVFVWAGVLAAGTAISASPASAQDEQDEHNGYALEEAAQETDRPGGEGAQGLDSLLPESLPPTVSEAPATELPLAVRSVPQRRLLVLETDYVNLQTLGTMLRVQAPDWEVVPQEVRPSFLRIDAMLQELARHDALLWFEPGDPMIRIAVVGYDGVSHVSLLPRSEAAPAMPSGATEPEGGAPAASEGHSTRSIALVVAALLSEMEHEQQQWPAVDDEGEVSEATDEAALRLVEQSRDSLAARVGVLEDQLSTPRASYWPTPIKPDGWFFRVGWVQAYSPQHEFYWEPSVSHYPTGGIRLAAGRHFLNFLSLGVSVVTLHAYRRWNGSVSAYASLHTPHRFRVGIGIEIGVLVATESNQNSDVSFGWVSPRLYVPLEIALMATRRGGVSVKIGPTFFRTPLTSFLGYDLSVEWEFD